MCALVDERLLVSAISRPRSIGLPAIPSVLIDRRQNIVALNRRNLNILLSKAFSANNMALSALSLNRLGVEYTFLRVSAKKTCQSPQVLRLHLRPPRRFTKDASGEMEW